MGKIKEEEIKKLETKLTKESESIQATVEWLQYETIKLIAKLSSAVKKLEETMDDSWIPKIEQYQKEWKNLQLRAEWEDKQIKIFNKNQEKLEELKKKLFIHKLSSRLKKIK